MRNLGHINAFLEFWAQLFTENLGTRRLAMKLEGTQIKSGWKSQFLTSFAQLSVNLYVFIVEEFKNDVKFDKK